MSLDESSQELQLSCRTCGALRASSSEDVRIVDEAGTALHMHPEISSRADLDRVATSLTPDEVYVQLGLTQFVGTEYYLHVCSQCGEVFPYVDL